MKMPKTTVKFKLEKTTPGAVRYQEVDDSGNKLTTRSAKCVIGSLYIRKLALEGNVPQEMTVDINT
jgi:hypothetical protein